MTQPVFFYDLGDPWCYLAAERIGDALGSVPEWEPVHGAALGFSARAVAPEVLAESVSELGLQPLRLPREYPFQSRPAMLAATFAKATGRGVAFSLAAFRQAFAGGRNLEDEANVMIAAAACELHPSAVLASIRSRTTSERLAAACQRAGRSGVKELPALSDGDATCSGAALLERIQAAGAEAA